MLSTVGDSGRFIEYIPSPGMSYKDVASCERVNQAPVALVKLDSLHKSEVTILKTKVYES